MNPSISPENVTQSAAGTSGWQLAVISGILGWTLDAFDFFIVVFLFESLASSFHVQKSSVVYTLTLTLAMRPLGALAFGALADRFGRKWPLVLCVLYFSLTTVLSGLAPNFLFFTIMRGLYGLGMGGYWGIGASYAMESAPPRYRGVLSGLMQSGYPTGYLIAAIAMQLVTPHLGWRAVFFLGFPIAVFIAALTAMAPESEAWKLQQSPSFSRIFRSVTHHASTFFYLLLLMSVMLVLSHGTQDLYPDFLSSIPSLADKNIFGMKVRYGIPILYNLGAIGGALFFGHLSEKIGRRWSIILSLVMSLLSIPAWAFGGSVLSLALGSFFMQMGSQGAWGVIPAHINELSPSAVRSLFPGFVYQLGVLIASPATAVEISLRDRFGYSWSFTIVELVVIVSLIFILWFGPEARGRDFSKLDTDHLPVH